jgi:hypothetical protein
LKLNSLGLPVFLAQEYKKTPPDTSRANQDPSFIENAVTIKIRTYMEGSEQILAEGLPVS